MKCKYCHKEIADDSIFCEYCRKKVKPNRWPFFLIIIFILLLSCVGIWIYVSYSNKVVSDFDNKTINVFSSDISQGTVIGSGIYNQNDTITIVAIANHGYKFVSWDDGNIENPRQIVVSEDVSFTAIFQNEETVTIVTVSVKSSDENMGTVIGGGSIEQYKTSVIEAIAKDGFRFVSWADGNIENPRVVIAGNDKTYTAKFEKIPESPSVKQENKASTQSIKQYSFGKYVGHLKDGIPEDNDGVMYYNRRIQIAKHDTKNSPHYAEKGDYYRGSWKNGDILVGVLYDEKGNIKEEIFAPGRQWPYDIESEKNK